MFTLLRRMLIGGRNESRVPSRSNASRRFRPSIEELEGRLLLSQTPLSSPLPVMQPAVSPMIEGGSLTINGKQMYETEANYQSDIKYLTVAPQNQKGNIFLHGTMAQIKAAGLEDPLRREIFNAMNDNQTYKFPFATLKAAEQNFTMRVDAVNFVKEIQSGKVNFGMFKIPNVPTYADPAHWHKTNPQGVSDKFWKAFDSNTGVSADVAIKGIVSHMFRGDCLGAIEIDLLYAADQAIGATAFNNEHPQGLLEVGADNPDGNASIYTNVKTYFYLGPNSNYPKPIRTQDMVPGDWAYMQNDPLYQQVAPTGEWTGENALYIGNNSSGVPLFWGLGMKAPETAAQLHQSLLKALEAAAKAAGQTVPANPKIYWQLLAQPIVGSPKTPTAAQVRSDALSSANPSASANPPMSPPSVDLMAADALAVAQALESGNVELAIQDWESFTASWSNISHAQQEQMEQEFIDDLFVDWSAFTAPRA